MTRTTLPPPETSRRGYPYTFHPHHAPPVACRACRRLEVVVEPAPSWQGPRRRTRGAGLAARLWRMLA